MKDVKFACQGCGSALNIDDDFGKDVDEKIISYSSSPRDLIGSKSNLPDMLTPEDFETKLSLLKYDYTNYTEFDDQNQLTGKDKALNDFFDKLTIEMGIDHPLCQKCCNKIILHLDKITEKVEKEYGEYTNLISMIKTKFKTKEELFENYSADEDEQLAQLMEEEKKLEKELEEVEAKRTEVLTEIETYTKKIEECEAEINENQKRLINIKEDSFSLDLDNQNLEYGIQFAREEIKFLSTTNALDLTFPIKFDIHCGTINGFRLAHIPSLQIPISELNSALGLTAFLIKVLFRYQGISHPRYEIVPQGSLSTVKHTGRLKTSSHPLYLLDMKKMTEKSPFNEAMTGLSQCLEMLVENILENDATYEFPYTVVNEYILTEEYKLSVKFMGTDDVMWTKAMKYFLMILKFAMVWCSRSI